MDTQMNLNEAILAEMKAKRKRIKAKMEVLRMGLDDLDEKIYELEIIIKEEEEEDRQHDLYDEERDNRL